MFLIFDHKYPALVDRQAMNKIISELNYVFITA